MNSATVNPMPNLMRYLLAAWMIMAFLIPSRSGANIPMHMQITLADKQGRVWVYALVDALEEENFSTQEKKRSTT
jgi:hypothetical protein